MKKEYDLSRAKRGAVVQDTGKTRITMYLDNEILEAYKNKAIEQGVGYQTLINNALRETLHKTPTPIDAKTLRRILREELKKTG